MTAALVPGTADENAEGEDEGEHDTDEPKENKETTKAQEAENQDATNKEKPQSPKLKGKRHLFCNYI